MLEFLIENGKLRVDSIETFHFLPDDHTTDIKGIEEMNSLKAFCALFLGKRNNFMLIFIKIFNEFRNPNPGWTEQQFDGQEIQS